eukprot:687876-Amphidinium_carterae.1
MLTQQSGAHTTVGGTSPAEVSQAVPGDGSGEAGFAGDEVDRQQGSQEAFPTRDNGGRDPVDPAGASGTTHDSRPDSLPNGDRPDHSQSVLAADGEASSSDQPGQLEALIGAELDALTQQGAVPDDGAQQYQTRVVDLSVDSD